MLIDEFLPNYDFSHHTYRIEIDAPIEKVYTVVRNLDLSDANLARVILWLRSVPMRLRGQQGLGLTLDDLLELGFILLADDPPRELVLGFVGQLWTASAQLKKLETDEFREFAIPGCVKAAMNFTFTQLEDGRTRLATESRAQCLDEASRRKFQRYWFFTNRLGAVFRRSSLRAFKRRAEGKDHLPRS